MDLFGIRSLHLEMPLNGNISECYVLDPQQEIRSVSDRSMFHYALDRNWSELDREFRQSLSPESIVYTSCKTRDEVIHTLLSNKPVPLYELIPQLV